MRYGLHALGIGNGARREIIDGVAPGAEARGFATLWMGEHVVMVDRPTSRYPYAEDGSIPVPADADWLDPLIGLSFAAAVTSRISLATGVLLLPEHQPLVVAKQAASLDLLCGGRLMLGVGIGWSQEELEALGVPFAGRGRRNEEYVAAMRQVWEHDVASFAGETVSFDHVRVNPSPLPRAGGPRRVPVVLGGNSETALRRVVRYGDGWYGFNLEVAEARRCLARLDELCAEQGRRREELYVAISLSETPTGEAGQLPPGVDETVIVAAPPGTAGEIAGWLDEIGQPLGLG